MTFYYRVMKYLSVVFFLFVTLIFLAVSPSKYFTIKENYTQATTADGEKVSADLVWHRKSVRILNFITLWPTKRQIELRNEKEKASWTINNEVRQNLEKQYSNFVFPNSNYYRSGWLYIALCALIYLIFTKFSSLRRDGLKYKNAKEIDNFHSYKNFLSNAETKKYSRLAKNEITKRFQNYKTLLAYITKREEEPPLRAWFLQLLEEIDPNVENNYFISFERNISDLDWHSHIKLIKEKYESIMPSVEPSKIEEYEASLAYLNKMLKLEVESMIDVATTGTFITFEKTVVELLQNIFNYIVSTRMIDFSRGTEQSAIQFDYKIQPESGYFTNNQTKKHYGTYSLEWAIKSGRIELGKFDPIKFNVTPQGFKTKTNTSEEIFVGMLGSSFANFSQTFLKLIGLHGSSDGWRASLKKGVTAEGNRKIIDDVIGELRDETIDQVLSEYELDIQNFVDALYTFVDTYTENAVQSVLSNILSGLSSE